MHFIKDIFFSKAKGVCFIPLCLITMEGLTQCAHDHTPHRKFLRDCPPLQQKGFTPRAMESFFKEKNYRFLIPSWVLAPPPLHVQTWLPWSRHLALCCGLVSHSTLLQAVWPVLLMAPKVLRNTCKRTLLPTGRPAVSRSFVTQAKHLSHQGVVSNAKKKQGNTTE